MLEEICEDLLLFLFPDAEKNLDFKRGFEFLDKELIEMYPEPEKDSRDRLVDKLVKVYLKDGKERWILFHVEVQGWQDKEFAKRMFTYYYRILDRYDRPVTAVAIFTGKDGKNMPDHYEDRFMGTHALYRYNTLRISDFSDADLMASDNPFAVVLLVAKQRLLQANGAKTDEQFDLALLEQKMLIVNMLRERSIFSDEKIAAIMTFLNNYVQFKKSETTRIFIERVDHLTGKKNTMGIVEQLAEIKAREAREEGKIEGREEGKIEARSEGEKQLRASQRRSVTGILNKTELSVEEIAEVVGVSVSFVEQVKNDLITEKQ